jgi:hypothetical protein
MGVQSIRSECGRAICLLSLGCLLAIIAGSFAPAAAQEPSDFVSWLQSLPEASQSLPLRRFRYFYEQRAYPNQTIPPGAMARARQEHEQRFGPLREQQAPGAPPAFNQTQWTSIGPKVICCDPFSLSQNSGRIATIAIDPINTNTIYIGAASGGVWKTEDGGTTWRALTDTQCSLAMGAIAIDPGNNKVIYAGTGENATVANSYLAGCGLLKSTDGGVTWNQMGASVFAPANQEGARISKIAIAGNTLMVASSFGLFRSTDGGMTFTPMVLQPLTTGGVATDVLFDPSNPMIIYAAIGNQFGSAGVGVPANGFYKSNNGGNTWDGQPTVGFGIPTLNVGRIALTVAPSSPAAARVLYAAIQSTDPFGSLLGIFKSFDGGVSWITLAATGADCGTGMQCWFDMYIAVDPTNAGTVYFGGVRLFKSTDLGGSFQPIGSTIHFDQQAFAFKPGDANTLYAGNDGGLYVSANGGGNWNPLNDGLVTTQFYPGLALNGSMALGGLQDNGTNFTANAQDQSPSNWTEVIGGDGGFAAIDSSTMPATGYGENQWGDPQFNGPRKSTNIGTPGSFTFARTGINVNDPARFIPPLVMSPTTSSTLYFGTNRLYRTTNSATNWNAISADLSIGTCTPAMGETPAATTGCVTTIAEAKSNGQVVYVGTGNGILQVTTDGGLAWDRINAGLPNRAITYVAVDPTNSDNVFVTVSGFGTGHVWKSTNRGGMWTDISGTMPARLPNIPVNAIVLDPTAPTTEILVGTDLGVYRTHDGGTTWTPFNAGLPNVPVLDLVLNQGTLAAATHGRGVWTAQIGAVRVTHDFNGDHLSDVLWFNTANGEILAWMVQCTTGATGGCRALSGGSPGFAPNPWAIVGQRDFNDDGMTDILWRNGTTGQLLVMLFNGTSEIGGGSPGSAASPWTVAGTGDFNNDGFGDILWYNTSTGQVVIWLIQCRTGQNPPCSIIGAGSPGSLVVGQGWTVAGTGDFNADGFADILFFNTNTGQVVIWLLKCTGQNGSCPIIGAGAPGDVTVGQGWKVAGTGDFNGDGRSDILWLNDTTGQAVVWLIDGTMVVGGGSPGSAPSPWTIVETGDFNSDGKSDILWVNPMSGQLLIWLLNGTSVIGGGSPGSALPPWQIQGMNAN